MSHENSPSEWSDDFNWFEEQLNDLPDEYTLEPDCESLDEQITRNLYYASRGSEIDMSRTRLIRIDTLSESIVLSPLGETSYGVICQCLNVKDAQNEVEFLFIGGTLFVPSQEKIQESGLVTKEDLNWPLHSNREAIRNYFEGTPNIVLNRSIATFGHFAYRYSFSEQEMQMMEEGKLEKYTSRAFYPLDLETRLGEFSIQIPSAVELTDRIVQITIEDDQGIKTFSE